MKKAITSIILSLFLVSNTYSFRVNAVEQNSSTSKDVQAVQGTIYNHNASAKEKIMSEFKNTKQKKDYKKDEILIKYKSALASSTLQESEKKHSINVKKRIKNGVSLVSFDNSKHSMEDMLSNLNNDSDIEYAEPNYLVKLKASPDSEPYFSYMWGLKNTTTPGIDINAGPAWNILTGNENVTVGVIDSGIDYNHGDLKDRVWVNKGEIPNNGIDDDNDGYIDDDNGWDFYNDDNDPYDDNGHGSHVSGIIAGSNNGKGIVGVAPNVKIMPLKVTDNEGYMFNFDVISAINYGVSKGVKIFNCSFAGDDYSAAEYDAIKNSNALFLAAAGNDGLNNDISNSFPANYDLPNIISVASIDQAGNISSFSNFGAKNVDIAAPGAKIFSTIPNNYAYMSGTSMATPFVTGTAALLLSENSSLSPTQIKDYILKNVSRLPSLTGKVATSGLLNTGFAVEAANPLNKIGVTGVILNKTSLSLAKGTSETLLATINPGNAANKTINWTSSDTNIATVDNSGTVSAVAEGTATITANTVDGNKTAVCSVTVTKPPVKAIYQGHVQNIGWQNWVNDGELSGTQGQGLRVEGFKINLENAPAGLKVKYKTHVQNIGWQNWVYDGALGGTEGQGLRVEALQIMLEGTDADKYSIMYQAHVQNIGWQRWVRDGEIAGTYGQGLRIEALRIRVVDKIPSIKYQGQVQNIGWQNLVYNGDLSGTEGKGLRVEGFKISLENAPSGLSVKYKAHVQNIGWQNWVYDGALSGTEGQSLRVEAFQIVLEGVDADKYSIEYQAHVQNIGWQPWVKDGQIAGTYGKGLRIEAIRIKVVLRQY